MAHPLYVAFFWHMHQPLYRDTLTGAYTLPWVRLHATKDYLHMGELLQEFPAIRQTFNFVPSLLEQLLDYGERGATDRWLEVSLEEQPSAEDKRFMLTHFFSINWDRIVRPNPHYARLLQLRDAAGDDVSLLSRQFWRDLAAWFNLAWIDPVLVERDDELRALRDKACGYTQADVRAIIDKHYEIVRRVIPLYRKLQDSGQIELTTSPYYHPILPLLIDVSSARVASPHLPLPASIVKWPEDAIEQLRRARERHELHFGRPPEGLWPSEGSVSEATIALVNGKHAFKWVASDEAILARSLGTWFDRDGYGHMLNPRCLYQPYLAPDGKTALVFRDRLLSDRIGFVYQHMNSREAADDLVDRLHRIRLNLADEEHPYLVPIVLDGENCWESYPNNGNDFLRHLYSRLASDPNLATVKIGEYIDRFPPRERLPRLFAGSWINQNLETWVGEEDQNRAWDYLARARSSLIAWQKNDQLADVETLARAWEEIYIAEGSDWFWWYYSHNKTGQEQLFDVEFRSHLANVYKIIGLPVPGWLKQPIAKAGERARSRPVSGRISPRLAVLEDASLEWAGAGYVEPAVSTGAMQRGATILRRLFFGYNPASLFLRLEANQDLARYALAFYLATPRQQRANLQVRFAGTNPEVEPPGLPLTWEVFLLPGAREAGLSQAMGNNIWQLSKHLSLIAVGQRTVELCIPLADVELQLGDEVGLLATVSRDDVLVEVLPRPGHVTFALT